MLKYEIAAEPIYLHLWQLEVITDFSLKDTAYQAEIVR